MVIFFTIIIRFLLFARETENKREKTVKYNARDGDGGESE